MSCWYCCWASSLLELSVSIPAPPSSTGSEPWERASPAWASSSSSPCWPEACSKPSATTAGSHYSSPPLKSGGSRIQLRCPGQHRQSLYRQQHHCHHHHRPHSQGHRPPLPPGPPENSQHTGHLLMPRARNHPLRSANADSLRTCRHFTHQHHRKPVLPLLHGNMRHTRHSAEIPQEILGRRMSDK